MGFAFQVRERMLASGLDVQTSAGTHGRGFEPETGEKALNPSSAGQALDPAARALFELKFHHSFARVRIHAEDESARRMNANAYTAGEDVVFAPGRYAPGTAAGKRLLAHELAHVVQHRIGSAGADTGVAEPEADRAAERAMWGGQVQIRQGVPTGSIQRQATAAGELTESEANAELAELDAKATMSLPPAVEEANRGRRHELLEWLRLRHKNATPAKVPASAPKVNPLVDFIKAKSAAGISISPGVVIPFEELGRFDPDGIEKYHLSEDRYRQVMQMYFAAGSPGKISSPSPALVASLTTKPPVTPEQYATTGPTAAEVAAAVKELAVRHGVELFDQFVRKQGAFDPRSRTEKQLEKMLPVIFPIVVYLTPGVGELVGVASGLLGKDILTGERLEPGWRVLMVLPLVAAAGKGVAVLKVARAVEAADAVLAASRAAEGSAAMTVKVGATEYRIAKAEMATAAEIAGAEKEMAAVSGLAEENRAVLEFPEFSNEFNTAAKPAEKAVAPHFARGNFGERIAADALAADGHKIVFFKPGISGTNQPGIDIVTLKDGVVYFVDNKALTSDGLVSSVTALTDNFAKNKNIVLAELKARLAAGVSQEERTVLEQTVAAIESNNYKRVVTNANLSSYKQLSGISPALKSKGLKFLDLFAHIKEPRKDVTQNEEPR